SGAEPPATAADRPTLAVRAAGRNRSQPRPMVHGVQRSAGAETVPSARRPGSPLVMLQQELPRIDSTPLDGWSRWLTPALIAGGALTVAILSYLAAQPVLGAIAVGAAVVAGGATYWRGTKPRPPLEAIVAGPDFTLVGSALAMCSDAAAL